MVGNAAAMEMLDKIEGKEQSESVVESRAFVRRGTFRGNAYI